jgi:hypothetical protein
VRPTTHLRTLDHVRPADVLDACRHRLDQDALTLVQEHLESVVRRRFQAALESQDEPARNLAALVLALVRAARADRQYSLIVVPDLADVVQTVQRLSILADSCSALNSCSVMDNHVELINGSWCYIDHAGQATARRFSLLDLVLILDADRIDSAELGRLYTVSSHTLSMITTRTAIESHF